jgi:transposase
MSERVELDLGALEAVLQRARTRPLQEQEHRQLLTALQTLGAVTRLLEDRKITIDRLRSMLFGNATEKTSRVFPSPLGSGAAAELDKVEEPRPNRKGHGRKAAKDYRGAMRMRIDHPSLKPTDRCPQCEQGKVYRSLSPAVQVRIMGQPPLAATVYEQEKLRCNLCGEVFTAPAPEGVGSDKYEPSAASMIGLLKYGNGFPFHRLEQLQAGLGIPVPASTQWGIAEQSARLMEPVWEELIRQAAQADVLHNDDTTIKVLELLGKASGDGPAPDAREADHASEQRTGVFTSGIVSTRQGRKIALFFTGRHHAGENLGDVLRRREVELGPPIQMCDALSRNPSREFQVLLANCLAHGRRKFVEVAGNFPEECRHVLDTLREVYRNEAMVQQTALSPQERLLYHQSKSRPLMEKLEKWLETQFVERKVEPNSGLGKAISYLRKHWPKLTLFLEVPGAPLDNNLCERALKRVILHRKNALFYKTLNGAEVGDIFMSLIHTCRLGGVDPFDYLTELQKNAPEAAECPQDWMPWNYRETLQSANRDKSVA